MSFKSNHMCFLLLASFFVLLSCEQYEDELSEDELLETRASTIGVYQAEDYTFQKSCREMSNHNGFTGSGFMDYGGNGSLVEWNNVKAPSAGQYILRFRLANGSQGNRQCEVAINNNSIGSMGFSPTGSWTNWKAVSIMVNLKAGINKIRVTANTAAGGPNLDKIVVLSNSGGGGDNGGGDNGGDDDDNGGGGDDDNGGGGDDDNGGGDGCNLPVHHSNYCSDSACGPCGEGEGDCDRDSDCRGDLVCRSQANGGDAAQPGHDICVLPGSNNGGDDDNGGGGDADNGGGGPWDCCAKWTNRKWINVEGKTLRNTSGSGNWDGSSWINAEGTLVLFHNGKKKGLRCERNGQVPKIVDQPNRWRVTNQRMLKDLSSDNLYLMCPESANGVGSCWCKTGWGEWFHSYSPDIKMGGGPVHRSLLATDEAGVPIYPDANGNYKQFCLMVRNNTLENTRHHDAPGCAGFTLMDWVNR